MKNQDAMITGAKWVMASIVGLWAGFPLAIHALLIFMGMDFVTGLIRAGFQGQLSSDASVRGLLKKAAMLVAVLFIHLLDGFVPQLLGMGQKELGLENIFAVYLIFTEIISIVENLDASGVRFPSPVIAALSKVKKLTPAAATEEEIRELTGDATRLTVSKSSEIVKTPDSQPDLKIEKTTTVLEEKHVEPVVAEPDPGKA